MTTVQNGQQEFDFTHRGYRRSLIQAYRCPNVEITEGVRRPTRRVMKARDLKGILRAIDDFGIICTASHATIAASADCDVTHLKRCLRALRELGLLVETRRPYGVEYRIVFSEISAANLGGGLLRDRPTDRPTGGSITEGEIDPQIDPQIDPNRHRDRPTGGSTNQELPITNNRRRLEPDGGVAVAEPMTSVPTAAAEKQDPWLEAEQALGAAGCELPRAAVEEAQQRGLSPQELLCAAYVVSHTPQLSGGALMFWIRKGGWPTSGIPTAQVLRQRRAEAAGKIRDSVYSDARTRAPPPPPQLVDAVCARRLREAGLSDLLTPEELDHERHQLT